MTRARDIIVELRDTLDANLTDPHGRQGNWIFDGDLRYDATLPRIGIIEIDTTNSPLSIGTARQVEQVRIQITVLVDEQDNKFDVDNDGNVEHEADVADYLANQIETIITNDTTQDTMRSNTGAWYILPASKTTTRPDGENVIQKNVDVLAEYIRT